MNFLFSDSELTPEAEKVLEEVFGIFQEEGYFTKQILANFNKFSTGVDTKPESVSILNIFRDYGTIEEGKATINIEQFKNFYK